ncbi:MAG: phenylalanine--tRNA ligase subunit beta [Ruminococcaceae bacterium]|nr:phenylalanine--tRNA ligase subunit beta [Oscillospiraceae bacterium]
MDLSLRWLKDYVDIDVPVKEYCDRMTMSGSKVEGYTDLGAEISRVVVGHVVEIERHPDSDHLFICQVDVGVGEPVQIVTGAQNVNKGDWVPAALDNSTLPGGIKIKKGKLRGVVSNGMLCSLGELGLTLGDFPYAIEDGIFILQKECDCQQLVPGADIKQFIGFDDNVVEFEITPNRPDCLSVVGLARETAATFDLPAKLPEPQIEKETGDINEHLKITVSAPDLCPRYTAKMIKNVKIAPSPLWLRRRLSAAGVRPINNIVDITNFVMLEYGQPMHAFDYSYISGGKIDVRRAGEGEKMFTLDDEERNLDPSMLVIADGEKAVAVAGVMGGQNSMILDTTDTIVFESANFSGVSVRLTSKKLGLRTEASSRFEKGLDPAQTYDAVMRACQLVEMLGAGEVVGGMIDVDNSCKNKTVIKLEPERINAFLGTDIPEADMRKSLTSLYFELDGDDITVPTFRADVETFADIAEEVARIYGYDKIAMTVFRGESSHGQLTDRQRFKRKIDSVMLACGYSEIFTYSFISPKYYDNIALASDDVRRKSVTILNPLGEDTSVMRTTMLPSIMESVARNYNFRNAQAKLYEIGKIYLPDEDASKLPEERKIISVASYGNTDFFAVKGVIEELVAALNVKELEFSAVTDDASFHPGRCAKVTCDGVEVGIIGQVHPLVCNNYGLEGVEVFAAMLDFELIFANKAEEKTYVPLPKYPAVTRDIALICDDEVPVAELAKAIKKGAGQYLENLQLFDVYRGAQVGEGKKSVAYSFALRASDRTLEDSEIENIMNKIMKNLEKDTGAKLRGI